MYRCAQISVAEHCGTPADIVISYDRGGGCTLRQAYYRLVSEGLIPRTAPTYRRLSSRLAQARREERFPDLIDPLREVHVSPAWPDAGAFLRAAPDWFALDRTAGQTAALYVACEKDTLRAQLTGWLERTGVPALVVRDFGSQSYVQVVRKRTARDPRPAVLLYVVLPGFFKCDVTSRTFPRLPHVI